jgi:hypothetical protein
MGLSIASNSDCHRSVKASEPFDFHGSVVEPPGLAKTVFYMSKRLAESAVLIGSMVLSNDSNSHRQFASIAPWLFDSQKSVVGFMPSFLMFYHPSPLSFVLWF